MHGPGNVHAARHPHDDPADEVDASDDDAGNGIAADELGCTVHRPVKLGLARQMIAPPPGFGFVDGPRVQLRIDRHLLARHRVQDETRRHFRDAPGAFRHDDELNDDENPEDDEPDQQMPLHNVVAERADDGPRLAVQQDSACRRDIQREPKQRGQQQHRWEHGEVERLLRPQRDQQQQDRQRQVEGEKHSNT